MMSQRKRWEPWTSILTPLAMSSKWSAADIQPLDVAFFFPRPVIGWCLLGKSWTFHIEKTERRSSWLDCPFYLRIGSFIFVIFALAGACGQVYIKDADIPTSFAESRDWFELFFDDIFAPPKLFNIVIQWLAPGLIICDHVHTCLFRFYYVFVYVYMETIENEVINFKRVRLAFRHEEDIYQFVRQLSFHLNYIYWSWVIFNSENQAAGVFLGSHGPFRRLPLAYCGETWIQFHGRKQLGRMMVW